MPGILFGFWVTGIANHHLVRDLIGAHFQGVDTNLQVISDALNAVAAIRRADISEVIKSWLLQSETDVRLAILREHLAKLGKQLRALHDALSRFSELGHINPQEWWGPKPWTLALLERVAEVALGKTDTLSSWLAFQRAASDVKAAKLSEITKLADSKSFAVPDLVPAYTYVLYNTLAHHLTRERPQLFQFSGLQQEAVRERFVQFDKDLIKLNRQSVALLASRRLVPSGIRSGPVGQRTELGLIEQEIAKKKRHIPYPSTHAKGRECSPGSEAVLHDGAALGRSVHCTRALETLTSSLWTRRRNSNLKMLWCSSARRSVGRGWRSETVTAVYVLSSGNSISIRMKNRQTTCRLLKSMRVSSTWPVHFINLSGNSDGITARVTIASSPSQTQSSIVTAFWFSQLPDPGARETAFSSGMWQMACTNRGMQNGTVPKPNA